jgi:excisionase family DNA binding protein
VESNIEQTRRGMTIQAFCDWSGVGRSFAYNLIQEGKIRARKAGKRTLIDAASAQAWWDALPEGTSKAA